MAIDDGYRWWRSLQEQSTLEDRLTDVLMTLMTLGVMLDVLK